MTKKILIVGGVAGGATTAARLRRLDERAQIIMFERGDFISFANCGLPYYIGDVITEKEKLTLQTPESFHARFAVDVRIKQEVISINKEDKQVTVKNLNTGDEYIEKYDVLVLSPGAEPVLPPIDGVNLLRVFTLRNIPDTYRIKEYVNKEKPQKAVVIGGGYIGIEMAENLHALGLEVTIVELASHLIGPLDEDVAGEIHRQILNKGVELRLKNAVKSIADNTTSLEVELSDDSKLHTDMIIMAVGVRPESSLAKNAGLLLNEQGGIIVNKHMLTSDPNIYAVGDAVEVTHFVSGEKSFIPLAGPANKQGRIAADHICGINSSYKNTQGTSILKCFDMTVAFTGINETQAIENGFNYEKSYTFSASNASYYPGASFMTIKLIWDKASGKVLGAQITGFDGVDKRCDVIATAIRAGMTIEDLSNLELCYAPPFSSAKDPVNMAGYVASNIQNGQVNIFHWHDVAALNLKESILLDVRTSMEFENGTIPSAINIPVDELRNKLAQLDATKTIYVFCQIGLRGYIACRILNQNGFKTKNLSGGYRLYNMIFDKTVKISTRKKEEKLMELTEKANTSTTAQTIKVDACGLQCPGPILKVYSAILEAEEDDILEVVATAPAFANDIEAWCNRTGNTLLELIQNKGSLIARIKKGPGVSPSHTSNEQGKNMIIFSGDLDKAIASFIIANGAAAMGRKVSMFFTFWGLNILRKPKRVSVKKDILARMFGFMMPRGSNRLKLSKMSMGGMGGMMIRHIMKKKNIDSLESLIQVALKNGVELVACNMTMDIMGIHPEELIDGVKFGGVASMLAKAEESDATFFI